MLYSNVLYFKGVERVMRARPELPGIRSGEAWLTGARSAPVSEKYYALMGALFFFITKGHGQSIPRQKVMNWTSK
jgi:hypothetical protein